MKQKITLRFLRLFGAAAFFALLASSVFVAPFALAKAAHPATLSPYYPASQFSNKQNAGCTSSDNWFRYRDLEGYGEMAAKSTGSVECAHAIWAVDSAHANGFSAWLWVPTDYADVRICFGFFTYTNYSRVGVGCVDETAYGDQWAPIQRTSGILNSKITAIIMGSNDGSTTTWIGIGCQSGRTLALTWNGAPPNYSPSSC